MFTNSLILALSSSIDSLGIGITYGIKNTKISFLGKTVLLILSFSISLLSLCCGEMLKNFFPDFVTKLIGNTILVVMGFFICFQAIYKTTAPDSSNDHGEKIYSFFIDFLGITIKIIKNPTSSDLDSSHTIDAKEALFLGFALSLDCLCIGISGSMIGVHFILFPLFISVFQLVFLNIGNLLGRKLHRFGNLPDNIWSILSGILLILIGIFRFV